MERSNYNHGGYEGGNRGGRNNGGRSSYGGRGTNGRGNGGGYYPSGGRGGSYPNSGRNSNYQQQYGNQHQERYQELHGSVGSYYPNAGRGGSYSNPGRNSNYQQQHYQELLGSGGGRGRGRESGGIGGGRGQQFHQNPRQNADRVPDRSHGDREGRSWSSVASNQPARSPPHAQTETQSRTDVQEGNLEADEEEEARGKFGNNSSQVEETSEVITARKPELTRDERERIRFTNVRRKKDFICWERVNGKMVNILEGLELHCDVFSKDEQNKIVDFVYDLQEMGKNGQFKARTYVAPQKWMKGKGRVTIQFGCFYNYATDKHGNPPGILQNELADPIPSLFKRMVERLVRWHVLPPTCVPDSCIVNIYDEGDCIPPHIDNHEFLRPFCTVSFLSECKIVFGSSLRILNPGEFSGAFEIPLPVGSVLVLNGNGADVAKHCVPAVPTKRISITFRKMDESKHPIGFIPESDLQGLEPLAYEPDTYKGGPTVYKQSSSLNSQITRGTIRKMGQAGIRQQGFENRMKTRLEY